MFNDHEDLFIWDNYNIDHIARHGVLPEEAEEAFWDEDRFPFNAHSGHRGLIGSTDEGRRLVVIFVKKEVNHVRIITARNAEAHEKRLYNKRRSLR
jgi:uncharacterized DUF497 family protein